MAEIIPAIIGRNFAEVVNKIRLVENAVNWVHLDIMDGSLTPNSSWRTPEDLESLNGKTRIEIHLMIDKPEEVLPVWLKVADRLLVHIEVADQLEEIAAAFTGLPVELGLALKLETPISKIESLIKQARVIHLMSIAKIG